MPNLLASVSPKSTVRVDSTLWGRDEITRYVGVGKALGLSSVGFVEDDLSSAHAIEAWNRGSS